MRVAARPQQGQNRKKRKQRAIYSNAVKAQFVALNSTGDAPLWAAMSLSSVSVIVNSLRLRSQAPASLEN